MLSRHGILDVQIASEKTESKSGQNMAYNLTYLRTGDLLGYKFNFDRVEPLFEINRVGLVFKLSYFFSI